MKLDRSNSFNKEITRDNILIPEAFDIDSRKKLLGIDSSNKGVYFKTEIYRDNVKYVVKTGHFNRPFFDNLAPIVEAICSEIAALFNINFVKYSLNKVSLKANSDFKKQDILVSVCPWYLKKNETRKSLKQLFKLNSVNSDYYRWLLTVYPDIEMGLNDILIFDFIVNNTDRHYKNLEIIFQSGNYRLCPLYDNGLSLFSEVSEEQVKEYLSMTDGMEELKQDFNYAKGFIREHYSVFDIVNINNVSINFNVTIDAILNVLNKYKGLISQDRFNIIAELLKERYLYARKLYINAQKH